MTEQRSHRGEGARKGELLAGKYLLDDCLGIGGMGEVYRATNVALGRKVAIKLLSPALVHDDDDVSRFLRAVRAAAAVRHPNVVDVLDIARDEDGTPFIVQELLAGEDLEHYLLSRKGRLSCSEAIEIMIPVADAVATAHAHGVVHRDLKPASIFLARDRNHITPKVLDFGACLFPTLGERSTKEVGILSGTPHYMAPEQILSRTDVDARSDVWALGIILYELIVGETPFDAENVNDVLQLVKTRDVPSLVDRAKDVPLELDVLVARCTKRDRDARYRDAGELKADMLAVRETMHGGGAPASARATIGERQSEPRLDITSTAPQTSRERDLLTLSSPASDFRVDIKLPGVPIARQPDNAPSSIPPVLDPRRSRASSSALPVVAPPHSALELARSPRDGQLDVQRVWEEGRSGATSMSTPRSWPQSSAKPQTLASRSREAGSSSPAALGVSGVAALGAMITLPAALGLVAVLAVPSVVHPVGAALRGDSTLSSGALAGVALVSAVALWARALFGERRTWALYVSSAGSVLFGIIMIVVTFAASEAAESGVPAAMGGISTLVAPIAPLALAAGMGARARTLWSDPDERGAAVRSAVVASLLLLVGLALSPIGAARARPPSVQVRQADG